MYCAGLSESTMYERLSYYRLLCGSFCPCDVCARLHCLIHTYSSVRFPLYIRGVYHVHNYYFSNSNFWPRIQSYESMKFIITQSKRATCRVATTTRWAKPTKTHSYIFAIYFTTPQSADKFLLLLLLFLLLPFLVWKINIFLHFPQVKSFCCCCCCFDMWFSSSLDVFLCMHIIFTFHSNRILKQNRTRGCSKCGMWCVCVVFVTEKKWKTERFTRPCLLIELATGFEWTNKMNVVQLPLLSTFNCLHLDIGRSHRFLFFFAQIYKRHVIRFNWAWRPPNWAQSLINWQGSGGVAT